MPKVLVVDDDRAVIALVQSACDSLDECQLLNAEFGSEGLELAQQFYPDVILLDLHLPKMHGFDLFQMIRSSCPLSPIIFITSDSGSEVIIQAMQLGAFDYLRKPLQVDQLKRMIASAASARRKSEEPVALSIDTATDQQIFVGTSPVMLKVFKQIGRVADQKVPVLIRGESGSGKELVARALVDFGKRTDRPFASLNCAAIPENLLESELFGHEKGSFTGAHKRRVGRFEQCHGGTIFLDEIGDMSLALQGKVLRLLQEQAFERVGGSEVIRTDVRIIAATHQPLEQMVEEGRFRQDLFFRLNGFTISLPPLRERIEDIPPLVEYFLRRAKAEMERDDLVGLTQDVLDALMNYHWPGNVRELQSVIRQAVLVCTTKVITEECLPFHFFEKPIEPSTPSLFDPTVKTNVQFDLSEDSVNSLNPFNDKAAIDVFVNEFVNQRYQAGSNQIYAELIEEVERRMLTQVLLLTEGNQSKASEILGITRGKIRDRIAAYGIKLDTTISMD